MRKDLEIVLAVAYNDVMHGFDLFCCIKGLIAIKRNSVVTWNLLGLK